MRNKNCSSGCKYFGFHRLLLLGFSTEAEAEAPGFETALAPDFSKTLPVHSTGNGSFEWWEVKCANKRSGTPHQSHPFRYRLTF